MRFLILCFFYCIALHTLNANPLYEAVIDYPQKHSQKANLQLALRQVIHRLTPGGNDLENPVIQSTNPQTLPHSTRYQTVNRIPRLYIQFAPKSINELMEKAGQQPWITTRPTVQTWVILVKDGKQFFANEKKHPEIFKAIQAAAAKKHLSLSFPGEELKKEMPPGHFKPKYSPVRSYHYADLQKPNTPEAVLVIEINIDHPGHFWEKWNGCFKNKTEVGPQYDRALEQIGSLPIDGMSKHLFILAEQRPLNLHSVYVNLHNVVTVKTFDAVQEYLEHIPGVIDARINSVTADAVLYKLELNITTKLLERRLNQKYKRLPAQPEENIINYCVKT